MAEKKPITAVEVTVLLVTLALAVLIAWPLLHYKDWYFGLSPSTYCMVNVNALGKGVLVYADENRGFLMPYTHALVPGTELTEAAPSADHTAVCFADGRKDPSTGVLADNRGLGVIYARGFLGPAELFYCPAQKYPPATLKHYPKPWGSTVPKGEQFIYCGYMFNPWVKRATTEGKRFVYDDGLVLQRHPGNRFLAADWITGPKTIAHEADHQARWNMSFPDGHVHPPSSKRLTEMFRKQDQTDWSSWEHWGAASADGQEPGPGTVRWELVKMMPTWPEASTTEPPSRQTSPSD